MGQRTVGLDLAVLAKRYVMAPIDDRPKSRGKSPIELSRPIRLAGSTLDRRAHVCALFNTPDEQYEVLIPFIEDGLGLGEKAVHTVDPKRRNEHIERLATAGIDIEAAHRNGQFELRDWANTHLRDGGFDQSSTLGMFQQVVKQAKQDGFPLIRFITHMEWTLEVEMDANDLLEYEARANDIWISQDGPVNPVICTYDLSRFSGDVVADVMRTHPMVIIGGILQENPFFVDPEELLAELRQRAPSQLKRVG
jgi:hypothetical protein